MYWDREKEKEMKNLPALVRHFKKKKINRTTKK